MDEFAVSTGVTGHSPPRRYLWTDAFAVCNFLGLWRRTGQDRYLDLAIELVRQVHHVLGRHRPDDSRTGWISGLSEAEGEQHPTRGGLRIGKPLNERRPGEPADPRLEWEQDGQYFHYLTKWMHALCRVSQETSDPRYGRWTAELAIVAHRAFTFATSAGGPQRMVWKMSIDLSRPLVSSMGQHDPLDGLVTCLELQAAGPDDGKHQADLATAIQNLTTLCAGTRWATDDPLGIGGLLDDAARLAQITFPDGFHGRELLRRVLLEAAHSLQAFDDTSLHRPAAQRLAFRELGLAIGMSGIERISELAKDDHELTELIQVVLESRFLAAQISEFWSAAAHRQNRTWLEHNDINAVMLATCLAPEGYLGL
jgi:hypothetical protein